MATASTSAILCSYAIWWSRRDLPPRPLRCRRSALLTELRPRKLGESGVVRSRTLHSHWSHRELCCDPFAFEIGGERRVPPPLKPGCKPSASLFCHVPKNERARQVWPPGPLSNKEQTPLGDLFDPNPRFHGGCFGV